MVTLHDPSNPAEVITVLGDEIREVWQCLDDGVSFADSVMADLRPDGHLWSSLVRHRALTLLASGGRNPRRMLNSGIEFEQGDFTIRVLKTQDDGPPAPGHSRARRS